MFLLILYAKNTISNSLESLWRAVACRLLLLSMLFMAYKYAIYDA
jgi:hypothetical protein